MIGRNKPTSEQKTEEIANQLIEGLNDLKLRFEIDSEALAGNILLTVEILSEMAKSQKADKKRKWIMDVVRDDDGLIKSIVARKI